MTWFDSHAHLHSSKFKSDCEEAIVRFRKNSGCGIITIGTTIEDSVLAINLAEKHSDIYAAVGVSPFSASLWSAEIETEMLRMCDNPKVKAIGETGLDYHYKTSTIEQQHIALEGHIAIAKEKNLPLIFHCRDSFCDMFNALEKYAPINGVLHCFSGGVKEIDLLLGLGLHISFSGIATYPSNDTIREALTCVPFEKLLIETDAPYLAPQEKRGKRNEPAYISHTGEALAQVLGIEKEELASLTHKNAIDFFSID